MPCIRPSETRAPQVGGNPSLQEDVVVIRLNARKVCGLALLAEGFFDTIKLTHASRSSIYAGLARMRQSNDTTAQAMAAMRMLELIEELVDAELLPHGEQRALRSMLKDKEQIVSVSRQTAPASASSAEMSIINVPITTFLQERSACLSNTSFTLYEPSESLAHLSTPRSEQYQNTQETKNSSPQRIMISMMSLLTGLVSLNTVFAAQHVIGARFNNMLFLIPVAFFILATTVGVSVFTRKAHQRSRHVEQRSS